MATLNLPTLSRGNATQCNFSLTPNTQSFESPLNKSVQTYELPGARWLFTATWANLCERDARIMQAWLASLRGAAGRFYGRNLSYRWPAGTANAPGQVKGAGQSGASITTDSWGTTSKTGWLMPGDYVLINGELKIVTTQCDIDGSGNATLVFEPPLRAVPADDAAILVAAASMTVTCRLNDDKQDNFNFDPDRHPSITISAAEVF